ncbi:hypothetical protein NM688_g5100 [Phlebia brevispora]|uniref:Uncharacterized protein n=1 Tax=Phlebia brevispora TaxID=194682 RepID=A0ACC1T0V5_9APHY|nr:hypothetical protein NM688_g5100 [Phlebia brevispora]
MSFYDVTPHARQSQASPSVSLEKGAYRLRAPPKRPRQHMRHDIRPSKDGIKAALRYEKQMAVLVISLVCATVTCFAAAYYLFTTRWDNHARLHTTSRRSDPSIHPQVVDFELSAHRHGPGTRFSDAFLSDELVDPEEQFIAYLPHSGFHNQRIAFENALVLSRLLNRTLLVPPVRLGKPLFYAPYDILKEMLVNTSKLEIPQCKQSTPDPDSTSSDCIDYFQFTDVPWSWLIDLSGIQAEQKLIARWDFSDAWLADALQVWDGDVFVVRDGDRDMYGFQDFISLSGSRGRKYRQMVHLSTLAHRTERLILLGTLFGTSRLHLRNPDNLQLRKEIRAHMANFRPFLGDISNTVRAKLGRHYLGAHVRLGDGIFEDEAERNICLSTGTRRLTGSRDPSFLWRNRFLAVAQVLSMQTLTSVY